MRKNGGADTMTTPSFYDSESEKQGPLKEIYVNTHAT